MVNLAINALNENVYDKLIDFAIFSKYETVDILSKFIRKLKNLKNLYLNSDLIVNDYFMFNLSFYKNI